MKGDTFKTGISSGVRGIKDADHLYVVTNTNFHLSVSLFYAYPTKLEWVPNFRQKLQLLARHLQWKLG